MKVWKRLWQLMSGPAQPTAEGFGAELAVKALNKLEEAQKSHIADLRLLMDQAHAREEELAGMVKLVVEEKFYRPVVTRGEGAQVNRISPAIAAEALTDVASFDEETDRETVQKQEALQRELAEGFQQIFREESDYRAKRGGTPVIGEA